MLREVVREVVHEELAAARAPHEPTAQAVVPAHVDYLTIAQAAIALSVSEKTVRHWIQAGKLRAGNAGRLRRIARSEIERFTRSPSTNDASTDELADGFCDVDTAEASEQRCRLPRIPFRFSAVANRLENSPVARIDRADECASALLAVARCPRVLRRREMDQHPHRHVTRNVATETTTMAKSGMNKIEIRAIPSQYTDGAWSRVIVRLGWCLDGTQVSITEERSAQAVGHRLVADALEATTPGENWTFGTKLITSYRDVIEIKVTLKLGYGTADEMERARAFLTELTGASTNDPQRRRQ